MADRNIVSYLAVDQGGFDSRELILCFEQGGFFLEHPQSTEVRGFTSKGEPVTYTRRSLFEAISSGSRVGFSLWKDESNDIFCTIRFKANCTIIGFELRGTTPDDQLAALIILMKYLTKLSLDRKLLGFVGDFEDMIETEDDSDRLFLK